MEIPEKLRKRRDTFRKGLLDLGFGQLYKGVYVYPWNITSKVLNLIDSLEIEDYITIISSNEFLINGIDPEGGNVLFSLDKLMRSLVALIPENSYYSPFVADIRNKL